MFPDVKVFKVTCKIDVHGFLKTFRNDGASLYDTARLANNYVRAAKCFWNTMQHLQKILSLYIYIYNFCMSFFLFAQVLVR